MADVFFLVEEGSEAGRVSQPVGACEPGLGNLSKPTPPAYFFGVKLMFIGVMNFGQNQKSFNHDFWSSSFGQVN